MRLIVRKRDILVIAGPVLSGLLLLVASAWSRARADGGPPRIGVGNVIATFDDTTESFNVFRVLNEQEVRVGGTATKIELVDHPNDADFAVTGQVEGTISKQDDPRRFEHDLKLTLFYWAHGKKVGSQVTPCKGSAPLAPDGPPDYRFLALAPCVRAQLAPMVHAFEAAK